MEFFHAEIYWSGRGEVVTNVDALLSPDGVLTDLNGLYAILFILLQKTEVDKLRSYLESEFGKSISDEAFEDYMERAFYIGTHIDSWFDLKKFAEICKQLSIKPSMFFYDFDFISAANRNY